MRLPGCVGLVSDCPMRREVGRRRFPVLHRSCGLRIKPPAACDDAGVAATFIQADRDIREGLELLRSEIGIVVRQVVAPSWGSNEHGHHFPRTLYGYLMNAFAFVDLLSQYDNDDREQTRRMVAFMERRMGAGREAASVEVQMWRHTLMHAANPRPLPRGAQSRGGGGNYLWLLHWGEPWLPRAQHMTVSDLGPDRVLNLGLVEFVEDLCRGACETLDELALAADGRQRVEHVEARIARAPHT